MTLMTLLDETTTGFEETCGCAFLVHDLDAHHSVAVVLRACPVHRAAWEDMGLKEVPR